MTKWREPDFPVVGKRTQSWRNDKGWNSRLPWFAITIYANDQFLVLSGIKEEIEKQITSLGRPTYETAKKKRASCNGTDREGSNA